VIISSFTYKKRLWYNLYQKITNRFKRDGLVGFYSNSLISSTHHLLTIFTFLWITPMPYCSLPSTVNSRMFLRVIHLSTLCEGFMQSTMDNADVRDAHWRLVVCFCPRQVLFATSRLTGRVPPWMRQGSRCRRPILYTSTLNSHVGLGREIDRSSSMYPSVIIVPNVLFRVRFDSIMAELCGDVIHGRLCATSRMTGLRQMPWENEKWYWCRRLMPPPDWSVVHENGTKTPGQLSLVTVGDIP
jgi:hypothetical protein